MQLLRGGLGLRPALHVQLVEDVADVGLHCGQLHVHDLDVYKRQCHRTVPQVHHGDHDFPAKPHRLSGVLKK